LAKKKLQETTQLERERLRETERERRRGRRSRGGRREDGRVTTGATEETLPKHTRHACTNISVYDDVSYSMITK
jgi:hypothetical protein